MKYRFSEDEESHTDHIFRSSYGETVEKIHIKFGRYDHIDLLYLISFPSGYTTLSSLTIVSLKDY